MDFILIKARSIAIILSFKMANPHIHHYSISLLLPVKNLQLPSIELLKLILLPSFKKYGGKFHQLFLISV